MPDNEFLHFDDSQAMGSRFVDIGSRFADVLLDAVDLLGVDEAMAVASQCVTQLEFVVHVLFLQRRAAASEAVKEE